MLKSQGIYKKIRLKMNKKKGGRNGKIYLLFFHRFLVRGKSTRIPRATINSNPGTPVMS